MSTERTKRAEQCVSSTGDGKVSHCHRVVQSSNISQMKSNQQILHFFSHLPFLRIFTPRELTKKSTPPSLFSFVETWLTSVPLAVQDSLPVVRPGLESSLRGSQGQMFVVAGSEQDVLPVWFGLHAWLGTQLCKNDRQHHVSHEGGLEMWKDRRTRSWSSTPTFNYTSMVI